MARGRGGWWGLVKGLRGVDMAVRGEVLERGRDSDVVGERRGRV